MRHVFRYRVLFVIVIALLGILHKTIAQAYLFDNLDKKDYKSTVIGSGSYQWYFQKFTTNDTSLIDFFSFVVKSRSGFNYILVNDVNGKPGSIIYDLENYITIPLGSNIHFYSVVYQKPLENEFQTIKLNVKYSLNPNTSYWLGISNTSRNSSSISWAYTDSVSKKNTAYAFTTDFDYNKRDLITVNNTNYSPQIMRVEASSFRSSGINSKNLALSKITATNALLQFTKGYGTNRLVLVKENGTDLPQLTDKQTYPAGDRYGKSNTIESGWYCIYNGSLNNTLIEGLKANTQYKVFVVDYVGEPGNEIYNTSTSSTNPVDFKTNNICTLPSDIIKINGMDSVCIGGSNTYSTNWPGNTDTLIWSYSGTGVSQTVFNDSIVLNFTENATSGTLSVKGKNSCGEGNSTSLSINVQGNPNTKGLISGISSICQGSSNILYSSSAIPLATDYQWEYSGRGVILKPKGRELYIDFSDSATSGNITVKGISQCAQGPMSNPYFVSVIQKPLIDGEIVGESNICQGVTSSKYYLSVLNSGYSYAWSFSGADVSISSNEDTATLDIGKNAVSGVLTIKGSNICGTGNPISININILNTPGIASDISGSNKLCQGTLNESFFVNEIPNAESYIWKYSGSGAAINGNGRNVQISFSETATNGNLTVQGLNSCSTGPLSKPLAISILKIPDRPSIISGSNTVCVEMEYSYEVGTVNGATNYQWYLTDNETRHSTNQNKASLYITKSSKNASLWAIASNSCGNSPTSNVFTIQVDSVPGQISKIFGENLVCSGPAPFAYYVDPIVNATEYIWSSESSKFNITSNGPKAEIVISNGGGFLNLSVYAKNNCGQSKALILPIQYNQKPDSAGPIFGKDSVCENTTEGFYIKPNSLIDKLVWNYSGNGLTIYQDTITIDNNKYGISPYDCMVKVAIGSSNGTLSVYPQNRCGDGKVSTLPIQILPLPGSSGSIVGNQNVCRGTQKEIYTIGKLSNSNNYHWSYTGNDYIIAEENNKVTLYMGSKATSGTLSVRGSNSCGKGIPINFPVNIKEIPTYGQIQGNSTICDSVGNFQYNFLNADTFNEYSWTYSGIAELISDKSPNATLKFNKNSTSGKLSVMVKSKCGISTNPTNFNITLASYPEKPLIKGWSSLKTPDIYCPGDTIYCQNPSKDNTYQWYLDSKPISGATQQFLDVPYDTTGYLQLASIFKQCITFSDTVRLQVKESLRPRIIEKINDYLAILIVDNSSNIYREFRWFNEGSNLLPSSIPTDRQFLALDNSSFNGTYRVELRDTSNCKLYSNPVKVAIQSNISVYPTVSDGIVFIDMKNSFQGEVRINVFEITGKTKVFQNQIQKQTTDFHYPINLGSIQPGLYIIDIEMGPYKEKNKILIQK